MNRDKIKNICVCISGSGRSLSNLLKQDTSKNCWRVSAVVSSSPVCKGNEIAKESNIPLLISDFSNKNLETTKLELSNLLREHNVDWIVLAGFLKMFPIIKGFEKRVINIHPALLPKFGGKGMFGHHVHEAVINSKEKKSGATVHFVNSKYDEGQIISQVSLNVSDGDTPDLLAKKVFTAECILLPLTLTKLVKEELPLPENQIYKIETA